MSREGGIGLDYEVFENRVWEWGIKEKHSMGRYHYV